MSDTDLQSSFRASNCTTWFFLMMVNSSRNRLRLQVINHSDQLLGKAPYKQWWMCECDFLGNAPLFKYVVVFLVAWVTPSFVLFCTFCSHEQSLEDRMVFGKLQRLEKPVQGQICPSATALHMSMLSESMTFMYTEKEKSFPIDFLTVCVLERLLCHF